MQHFYAIKKIVSILSNVITKYFFKETSRFLRFHTKHERTLYLEKDKGVLIQRMYSRSKKKRNTPIYFNTNYHTEMKLVPIIMD